MKTQNNHKKVSDRYFIKLSYNGTNYHGWQSQPGVVNIQATVSNALKTLLKEDISLTGAGRTDTGVHAKVFYAHFDSEQQPHFFTENNIVFKLNCILPHDIAVYSILLMKDRAHARYDATSRTYQYIIERKKNPFTQNLAYYYNGKLDLEIMKLAAGKLFSHSDFTSFSKSNTQVNHNICEIMDAKWYEHGSQWIFEITANRFLRGMVRAVVGTLIEIGRGKLPLEDFEKIIESKNRQKAGYTVPGYGLYLTDISYPGHIFIKTVSEQDL